MTKDGTCLQTGWTRLEGQEGIALLTVALILLIMTVIGIASITVTSLENRMAGYARTGEAAGNAAESCIGTGVVVIQQTIYNGTVPTVLLSNANPPGPVPQNNATLTGQEIMGQSDNNADTVNSSPANLQMQVNAFTITGDVDRLYAQAQAGGSLQFAAGYEGTAGGAAGGGVNILYRVDCQAKNPATGTTSHLSAIYSCTASGQGCQRKI